MGFEYWLLILAVIGIGYLVIKGQLRIKQQNKTLPNIVYLVRQIFYPISSREALIFQGINRERILDGGEPVIADWYTDVLTKERTEEVDDENKITHKGAPANFIKLSERGVDGSAEIIAYAYGTVNGGIGHEETEEREGTGWMGSDSHREALLNGKYQFCGVGCKKDEHNNWIDIVIFGYEKNK